jgi:hypothetical protein
MPAGAALALAVAAAGKAVTLDGPMAKLNEALKIEAYLREQGWPIIHLGPETLRSSFRGTQTRTTFPLVVQFEEGWVKLVVLPIARLPADGSKAERLYERLLRLNGEIMLARFSLDEDGDVLLSVEFPAGDLDASEIQDALDVLTYYAEKLQPEIKAIVA